MDMRTGERFIKIYTPENFGPDQGFIERRNALRKEQGWKKNTWMINVADAGVFVCSTEDLFLL